MRINDVFRPGQYVMTVPVGVNMTLQYDSRGVLEKLFLGFAENRVDTLDDDMIISFKKNHVVPESIPLRTGTTWVTGVLYTGKRFDSEGELPDCVTASIIEYFRNNPEDFKFYAGNVSSTSTLFRGAAPTKQWLQMSKFNVLGGVLVPASPTHETLWNIIRENYQFVFPYISSYIVYDGQVVSYISAETAQYKVTDLNEFTTETGNARLNLKSKYADNMTSIDYGQAALMHIQKNAVVVTDERGDYVYSFFVDKPKHRSPYDRLECPWCGKPISVNSYETYCSNPHCLSLHYGDFQHFLKTLGLMSMSFNYYETLSKDRFITNLSDMLDLPEYEDVHMQLTLSRLIDAVVPISCVHDRRIITVFTNHCNNSINTVHYYLTNPDKIESDFNLSGAPVVQLVKWLSDKANSEILDKLITCKNFDVSSPEKKFDGDPIFRGKKIYITGNFKRGSRDEVAAILRSYAAEISDVFDETCNCVIAGSTHEDINGVAVKTAKLHRVPIFDEDTFFSQYDIDKDLQDNLL